MNKTNLQLNFNIWALGDLHLSFGIKNKEMDVFGKEWRNWTNKLRDSWTASIQEKDLVLIPGDISWASHLEGAIPDLEWIDRLPGTKVLIRGNHDYWWSSKNKIKNILPPSIHIIQNDAYHFQGIAIAGARLWDTPEFNFDSYIEIKSGTPSKKLTAYEDNTKVNEKIFRKELIRLELSLKEMNPDAALKICMTHYPPINAALEDSKASKILELYGVDFCLFGHLHSVKKALPMFGEKSGITYCLTSCDYLNFSPLKVI